MRLLITGIGGDVGQAMAAILRESYSGSYLIGIDIFLDHAGSVYVDDVRIVPRANQPGYLKQLEQLADSLQVDYVLISTEQELRVIADTDTSLPANWICCSKELLQICLDKYSTNRFLSSLGIDVPWTVCANESLPLDYPCIAKARQGAGSKSIVVVKNENQARDIQRVNLDFIFQEYLLPDDEEYTCTVYRDKNDAVYLLALLRFLQGGMTFRAQSVRNTEIDSMCKSIASNIDLRGSINIQLRLTSNGPRVFEINPRFSSTVLMRHRMGFSDLVWSLQERLGEPIEYLSVPPGVRGYRVYDMCIVKDEEMRQ